MYILVLDTYPFQCLLKLNLGCFEIKKNTYHEGSMSHEYEVRTKPFIKTTRTI